MYTRDKEESEMSGLTERTILIALLLCCLCITVPVCAMLNPSAVYCDKMGYSYETLSENQGDYGVCHLPNNETVRAWAFLRGEAGQKYSYCAKMGYPAKNISDPKICAAVSDNACSVCVLPDNREVEVTTLMNLSFDETFCGDGVCAITEDALSCPQDCPQSGKDGLCQKKFDLQCDRDCLKEKDGDIDCVYLGNPLLTIIVVLAVILVLAGIFFWMRKKKPEK
jgi:putative hemolysin